MPTSLYPTVAELRTEFLQRKKDTSDIDAISGTFLQWCNYINRFAYRELVNIMPETYITNEVITTVPQTASYALPATFQDIIPMGTGLYEINAAGVDTDNRVAITNYGSTKNGFYLTATHIVFTPTPTETKQYRFRFIPLLDDLTAEDDELIIPKRFSQHIVDLLDQMYLIWDEQPSEESWNDERIQKGINELVSLINPIGQSIIMPDFSSEYYY